LKVVDMIQGGTIDNSYVCPRTHVPLRQDGTCLKTDAESPTYALEHGIPQFLHFQPADDPEGASRLQRLNALARSHGWKEALATVFASEPGTMRYVTDARRAAYPDMLPIDPSRDVLEIGPGLGQMTTQLARRARSVSVLEVVPGQAEFVAQRCAQEQLHNVRVAVGGDDCRLPYADASFDLVVLNLVFEWCGSRCHDEDMLDVQRRLLDEMARVLRPGGTLYLATKNRFALRYLLGRSDEHMHDLRFGNALPRWLARLVLRATGRPRPPGLLHSHDTLGRMLKQAGFDALESFWAAPEMRYPSHYVPTDAAAVRAARREPGFVQGDGRLNRLVMSVLPAPWVRHFTPGLAFLARKPGAASAPR
jgi:SAM-dependent methyltransferase